MFSTSIKHQQRLAYVFSPFKNPLTADRLKATRLQSSSSADLETEVKSLKIREIKQELESYGISTKTFLEKRELVDALVQARREGKTPISTTSAATTSSTASTASSTTSSESATSASSSTAAAGPNEDRQSQIAEELTQTSTMRVAQLKSELEGTYGISTNTFLEKSELAEALAEARVDDRLGLGGSKTKTKKKKRRGGDGEDVEEVKAAKVEVITSDNVGPKKRKNRDSDNAGGGSPFGGAAGGSPFGAAAGGSPFGPGGMGGMGGMDMGSIADMMKNMGGGGGAGGNPFAGAAGGGNPFAGGMPNMGDVGGPGMGDVMKQAQEAMKNPKVQAVMAKAQKNPKVMAAVQECMGNPMAMTKYMSDPEVGPILKELQESMMG